MKRMKWNQNDTEEVFKGIVIGIAVAAVAALIDWGISNFLNPDGKKSEENE